MNIFKAFGLKKAPKGSNRQPYPRLDRDTIMEGWGSEGMSRDEQLDMEGRDESYGEWVNRKIEEGAKKQEDDWKKKFAEEGHTMPKRFKNRPIDEGIQREKYEEWARDWSDHFAAQEEADRPEAGVPVKDRGSKTIKPDYYDSRKYRHYVGDDIGGRKGQTLADKRVGRDVRGTRPLQRDPMPYEGRGKDFGVGGAYRKPKAEAVLNMFKAFGLYKKKDDDVDEDKKKTPNGGENGD